MTFKINNHGNIVPDKMDEKFKEFEFKLRSEQEELPQEFKDVLSKNMGDLLA